jgi:hypothetical protein
VSCDAECSCSWVNYLSRTDTDDKPIKSLDLQIPSDGGAPALPIPRKPRAAPETNGHDDSLSTLISNENGNGTPVASTNGGQQPSHGAGIKRNISEVLGDDTPHAKKTKVSKGSSDDVIILDDEGAILIDD